MIFPRYLIYHLSFPLACMLTCSYPSHNPKKTILFCTVLWPELGFINYRPLSSAIIFSAPMLIHFSSHPPTGLDLLPGFRFFLPEILLLYPSCPPSSSSTVPHSYPHPYPHPLFLHPHLFCPSALLLVPPFSFCCSILSLP